MAGSRASAAFRAGRCDAGRAIRRISRAAGTAPRPLRMPNPRGMTENEFRQPARCPHSDQHGAPHQSRSSKRFASGPGFDRPSIRWNRTSASALLHRRLPSREATDEFDRLESRHPVRADCSCCNGCFVDRGWNECVGAVRVGRQQGGNAVAGEKSGRAESGHGIAGASERPRHRRQVDAEHGKTSPSGAALPVKDRTARIERTGCRSWEVIAVSCSVPCAIPDKAGGFRM